MYFQKICNYSKAFSAIKVEVIAQKEYIPQAYRKNDYFSNLIIESKYEDVTKRSKKDKDFLNSNVLDSFNIFKNNGFIPDLICIVPRSEINKYSPTIFSLADELSKVSGVPFDNIILRIKDLSKRIHECNSINEKVEVSEGTLKLSRELKPNEKKILIIDDITTEGITKLFCAELFIDSGAKEVKSISLGITSGKGKKIEEKSKRDPQFDYNAFNFKFDIK